MKIEYDPVRDLLYLWFAIPGEKAARTETIAPGVHTDFDRQGRLIGLEVLDASAVWRHKVQFEVQISGATQEPATA